MTVSLITGGAGFLGSHICEQLLRETDSTVISIDNLASGRMANFERFAEENRLVFFDHDVREPLTDILSDVEQVDRIYHMASRASPADFDQYPVEIAMTNSTGTNNVFQAAHQANARVVYASTSEVYGDPETHPQSETYYGNVNPRGKRACYDESKRFGEALSRAYIDQYDLDIRTVRIFNTYGPRMRPNDGRVIPNFVTQALRGEDLTVYGDGTQTRSFCYVDDTVRGIRHIMDQDGIQGEVMNIGSQQEMTILTLAEQIQDLIDDDLGITHQGLPEDDPTRRRPDIHRARKMLYWEPEYTLREGLRKTIRYFAEEELDVEPRLVADD